jgi:hypothetical protein
LGSLSEFPISTDALPAVMSVCKRRWKLYDESLTIREALWVARIYKLIEQGRVESIPPDVNDALIHTYIETNKEPDSWPVSKIAHEISLEALLDDWASTYAGYEQLAEDDGEPFDSSELDGYTVSRVYEYWGERREDEISDICVDYGLLKRGDFYKLLTLDYPISDIREFVKSGRYKSSMSIPEMKEILKSEEFEEYMRDLRSHEQIPKE